MTAGRLIAVVGPSGVGKDSVMMGLHDAMANTHLVRRVITRKPGLGGEDYAPATPAEFEDLAENGAFIVHWEAHGLRYGIPQTVRYHLNRGEDCIANFSRKALLAGADAFETFIVLNITAEPETLAKRLASRGRETEEEIARRLAVADKSLPVGLTTFDVSNDGPLTQTVARAAALLQPVNV